MQGTKKVDILLNDADQSKLVGQLVLDQTEVLFKYSGAYLQTGQNLSPIKLTFNNSIQKAHAKPFNRLFGVFADSIPDAWGRLLLRRKLAAIGLTIETLTPLDFLLYTGSNSPGALSYRPSFEESFNQDQAFDLDLLNEGINEIMEGESAEVIDALFSRGGSPGGARPKTYAGYDPKADQLMHGQDILPQGYEHWIVKFAATIDRPDIANMEMAYYQMALDAGIQMMESRLFTGVSGKVYFGTKRFDRIGNKRVHMISAAGMFHDDYEHSQMDYGTLIHESIQLINDARVTDQIFRRAAFNVFAHNRDDHSKNFAFLMTPDGAWSFAPAYDLTFSSSSHGMHSTTVAKNGFNPGRKELLELAEHFSIKHGDKIIGEVKAVISEWKGYAERNKVSKTTTALIANRLKEIC